MAKIGIISAGAWGTAIGSQLGKAGHTVRMWAREEKLVNDINELHENTLYLPGYTLSENVSATKHIEEAVVGNELIILASPSQYLVSTVEQILKVPPFVSTEAGSSGTFSENGSNGASLPIIGILSKGFLKSDEGQPLFITQVLEKMFPEPYNNRLLYISGPSHAEEVVQGKVTGLIVASSNPIVSIRAREILKSRSLLVFSSLDVIGVQTCAAAKNIMAIAFGILSAITEESPLFGDNCSSLLLAASLNEMQTLGKALGATHSETFTSIAGVGDLDVTCRSEFGRNRRLGREIVQKKILDAFSGIDDILEHSNRLGYLAEGVSACKYVHQLAVEKNVKLPISDAVYKILNKEATPQDIIFKLLDGEKDA